MEEQPILLLGKFLRPSAGADDHAKAPVLLQGQGSSIEPSVIQSLSGRRQRQWQHSRNVFSIALFHPSQLVKIRNLASDLHRNFRRIETRNAPHPAPSAQNALRKSSIPHAVRTNHSHSGYHDSSFQTPPRKPDLKI